VGGGLPGKSVSSSSLQGKEEERKYVGYSWEKATTKKNVKWGGGKKKRYQIIGSKLIGVADGKGERTF